MTMKAYRAAVVEAVRAKFPTFDVGPHGGRFTIESLKAFTVKAPAIRVAVLGFGRVADRADGVKVVPITAAAFIVTKDTPTVGRDDQVLDAVDQLVAMIDGEQLIPATPTFSGQLANVTGAQNLYDADIQSIAVALWAVSWTQNVLDGTPIDVADDLDWPDEPVEITDMIVNGPGGPVTLP